MKGCVAGLSTRDATAIVMVTQLGFTPEQVAGALGLTAGATKVLLHRARRRMRHALVLQVMVRQPDLACPELKHLVEDDPLAAVRHVETCETCISRAATEVMTFQQSPTEAGHPKRRPRSALGPAHPRRGLILNPLDRSFYSPSPTTLTPLSRNACPRASANAPGRQSTSGLGRRHSTATKPVTSSPSSVVYAMKHLEPAERRTSCSPRR